jgi:hypothetical protein
VREEGREGGRDLEGEEAVRLPCLGVKRTEGNRPQERFPSTVSEGRGEGGGGEGGKE